ncbi:hypothetical protein, partial [uncultured Roseovarius sp.]|uniref:hypothetical protein n=1 Tax=uncultured Roseovarius sp. TaxID=293344 RepID=UPI00261C2B69
LAAANTDRRLHLGLVAMAPRTPNRRRHRSSETSPPSATVVLDVSERESDFQYRIQRPAGVLLKNCMQNYEDLPCKYYAYAYVLRAGGQPISDLEMLQNILPPIGDFPIPLRNRILPQYELATSYCTQLDQAVLLRSLTFSKDRKYLSASIVPEEIEHCFSGYDRGSAKLPRNYLLMDDEKIFARVECSTLEAVPNPTCQLTAYPSSGNFRIEIGPFPKRNLRILILNAQLIIQEFIDEVPIEFPDDFVWTQPPRLVRISETSKIAISLSEEKLK